MGFFIIKVKVPDIDFVKSLKVNEKDYIYKLKEDLIKKCGKKEIFLNYGILLCNEDQQPGIFINEGKTLSYYSIDDKVNVILNIYIYIFKMYIYIKMYIYKYIHF